MDNEFILMSKGAEEIQPLIREKEDTLWSDGNYIYMGDDIESPELIMIKQLEKGFGFVEPFKVPRQEELQDICIQNLDNVISGWTLVNAFKSWEYKVSFYDNLQQKECLKSISRMWLAFAMEKIFNKRWDFETKKWEVIE